MPATQSRTTSVDFESYLRRVFYMMESSYEVDFKVTGCIIAIDLAELARLRRSLIQAFNDELDDTLIEMIIREQALEAMEQ